jgi:hypothetical protein
MGNGESGPGVLGETNEQLVTSPFYITKLDVMIHNFYDPQSADTGCSELFCYRNRQREVSLNLCHRVYLRQNRVGFWQKPCQYLLVEGFDILDFKSEKARQWQRGDN